MARKTRSEKTNTSVTDALCTFMLGQQQQLLDILESVVEKTRTLQAIIVPEEEGHRVILPTRQNSRLGMNIAAQVEKELNAAGFKTRLEYYQGHHAYNVTDKQGRSPAELQSINIETSGLAFVMGMAGIDATPSFTERKYAPRIRVPRVERPVLPADQIYQPPVTQDQTFDVRIETPSALRYRIIPLRAGKRELFPGAHINFELRFGSPEQTIQTRVVGGSNKDPVGSCKGAYLSTGIKAVYEALQLKGGDTLRFRVVEPGKIYKIE